MEMQLNLSLREGFANSKLSAVRKDTTAFGYGDADGASSGTLAGMPQISLIDVDSFTKLYGITLLTYDGTFDISEKSGQIFDDYRERSDKLHYEQEEAFSNILVMLCNIFLNCFN